MACLEERPSSWVPPAGFEDVAPIYAVFLSEDATDTPEDGKEIVTQNFAWHRDASDQAKDYLWQFYCFTQDPSLSRLLETPRCVLQYILAADLTKLHERRGNPQALPSSSSWDWWTLHVADLDDSHITALSGLDTRDWDVEAGYDITHRYNTTSTRTEYTVDLKDRPSIITTLRCLPSGLRGIAILHCMRTKVYQLDLPELVHWVEQTLWYLCRVPGDLWCGQCAHASMSTCCELHCDVDVYWFARAMRAASFGATRCLGKLLRALSGDHTCGPRPFTTNIHEALAIQDDRWVQLVMAAVRHDARGLVMLKRYDGHIGCAEEVAWVRFLAQGKRECLRRLSCSTYFDNLHNTRTVYGRVDASAPALSLRIVDDVLLQGPVTRHLRSNIATLGERRRHRTAAALKLLITCHIQQPFAFYPYTRVKPASTQRWSRVCSQLLCTSLCVGLDDEVWRFWHRELQSFPEHKDETCTVTRKFSLDKVRRWQRLSSPPFAWPLERLRRPGAREEFTRNAAACHAFVSTFETPQEPLASKRKRAVSVSTSSKRHCER